MGRKLFTLAAAVSLLLSLILWLHSAIGRIEVTYVAPPGRVFVLGSARGSVRAELNRYSSLNPGSGGLDFSGGFFVSPWNPNPPGRFGFGYLDRTPVDRYADRNIIRRTAVALPWWLAIIPLTLLSIRTLWGLGNHRMREGLCPSCGYDLRATPDRCPECGTPVPVQAK